MDNIQQLPPNLRPDGTSPEWLNKGDNAWQLTAATLVALQSMPGLVILYGGMVKKKWAVNSSLMAAYAFAATLICWVGWGYSMSFGDKLVVFWGKPALAVDDDLLLGQAFLGYFPTATMVWFQFGFAGITTVLIGGALLGRMNFTAWVVFVPLWHTFSYTVGAFSVWSTNGWLANDMFEILVSFFVPNSGLYSGSPDCFLVLLFQVTRNSCKTKEHRGLSR